MSDTQTVGTSLTVDLEQFDNWLNGVLIDNNMVVNEAECIAANDALQRGETVLLRNGSRLAGTSIKLIDGAYKEVK